MTDFVVLLILVTSLPALGLFVFFYGSEPVPGTRFQRRPSKRWTIDPIGIILMGQKVAFFSVLSFILLSRFVGDFPGRDLIALVLYSVLEIFFWLVFAVLRHTQLPYEREQRSNNDPSG